MALDALRVALQGLYRLTPIALAVQGLIDELQTQAPPTKPPDSAGSRTAKRARAITRQRYLEEDDAILMAIISAVTGDCLARADTSRACELAHW